METSKVFYADLRTNPSENLPQKLIRLVRVAGIDNIDFEGKFTAIKIHFGEPGNVSYIRPNFVAAVVDYLKSKGAKVYLSDSNTLYSGGRSNAVDHLNSAINNGFNLLSAHANVVIADGIRGTEFREIPIEGEICKAPKIGAAIADADIVISMNHFKGHEMAGFGGALKNLGMGSASVAGKLELHSGVQPQVVADNCKGCKICEKNCSHGAITVSSDRKAHIDYSKCTGCGQCVALCQFSAAVASSDEGTERLNRKIAEYAKAVVKDKPSFHISFIMNVSPNCDCWCMNDAAIIPDLGILASFDPVALDQACGDMANAAPVLATNNVLHEKYPDNNLAGEEKFHHIHPDTRWEFAVEHGEKINLGNRKYELIKI